MPKKARGGLKDLRVIRQITHIIHGGTQVGRAKRGCFASKYCTAEFWPSLKVCTIGYLTASLFWHSMKGGPLFCYPP